MDFREDDPFFKLALLLRLMLSRLFRRPLKLLCEVDFEMRRLPAGDSTLSIGKRTTESSSEMDSPDTALEGTVLYAICFSRSFSLRFLGVSSERGPVTDCPSKDATYFVPSEWRLFVSLKVVGSVVICSGAALATSERPPSTVVVRVRGFEGSNVC